VVATGVYDLRSQRGHGNRHTPFGFIWIAVSTKGTVVKIDTDTGQILGEYWTSPEGQPKDPSRTTVDANGSVCRPATGPGHRQPPQRGQRHQLAGAQP